MSTTSPLITIRQASGSYPVFVGRGLAERTGALIEPRGNVFVLTAPSIRAWGDRVARSFEPHAPIIEVDDGEQQKTLATANAVITQLLDRGARRDSTLIVVGGGVLGDVGAFAAAIFMRGIDVVHVPTTLLAQVDSSIGGKTGVNHERGKNLIGAFHVPRAVITDPACLETLAQRELIGGLFEALKSGVIADAELFELFEHRTDLLLRRDAGALEGAVARSVRVKASIVLADERESGPRRLLNYGHTIGHAVEAVLRYADLTHGEAVAWGMVAANAISVRRGLLAPAEAARVDGAIAALGPTPIPPVEASSLVAATAFDKKNTARTRVMVLPRAIGDPSIVEDVTDAEIAYGVEAMLERSGRS